MKRFSATRVRSTENTPLKVLLVPVVLLVLAPVAHAGIADSPIPNLTGSNPNATKIRYTAPGVINNNGLSTYFSCTSTETTSSRDVAVELFQNTAGSPLNDAVTTKLTVGPGETVIFGTRPAVGIAIDKSLGDPGMTKGSARVVSTSAKNICTVYLADNTSNPPISMTNLSVVKALGQKGD